MTTHVPVRQIFHACHTPTPMNPYRLLLPEVSQGPLLVAAVRSVQQALLLTVSLGTVALAEPQWREIALEPDEKLPAGEAVAGLLPASKALTTAFDDLTQCHAGRDAGTHGVIVTTELGLQGRFLAICWDERGGLSATLRSDASLPVESYTLRDGIQPEITLMRRGACVYAYARDSRRLDPLIALEFPFDSSLSVGALSGSGSGEPVLAISGLMATPMLTADVRLKQPRAELGGEWKVEESAGSLGGSHLVNPGDDPAAFAQVTLENLQPGTHELWIRYSASGSRSDGVEVTVAGFASPVSLTVDQKFIGGIWIALGRQTLESAATARIRVSPSRPGTGSISLDAVRDLWFARQDENSAKLPGLLDGSRSAGSQASTGEGIIGGSLVEDGFSSNKFSPPSPLGTETMSEDTKSVIYVHSTMGNDLFDGRMNRPHPGAWFSVRGGPKRTIEAALNSVPKSARVVELHLDGKLEPPVGGFQDLGNFNLVLVPGKDGASLESVTAPFQLPAVSSFPIPPKR